MLIIKSLFYQIAIPDNESYAIYSKDSFVDEDGNILDETYGDIIIQTPSSSI